MATIHIMGIYGIYIGMFYAKISTLYFTGLIALLSMLGIQCGAHRLWSHRTYKAKLPLQILLAFLHIMALENDIYEWSRDHRVHHKYSETDADPHNAKRGFFFAHVGWLLCKKHPDVIQKGKTIDMSNLEKDPLVRFQRTFYIPLVLLIWGAIPMLTPYYYWGESLWITFIFCIMTRYVFTLNVTWTVNSAAHLWGTKPYDKSINPVECVIRNITMGECFHNYHHTFPWDYSASEFGALDVYNPATAFINFFAWIGWAYDLRKASKNVIKSKQDKNGDPTFKKNFRLVEWLLGSLTLLSFALPFILGVYLRDKQTIL